MSKLEFSIEKLIEEVKKRPCLYDTTDPEYRDKKGKDREWLEVCREVCTTNKFISGWDDLNESEKTDFLIEVKRKWTSLRDCFKRELRLLEKNEHKKRKYYFFDALQFLEPFRSKQCDVNVEYENVMDEEINIKQEFFTYDTESEQFVKNSFQEFVNSDINPDCIVQMNSPNEYDLGENSHNESIPKFENVIVPMNIENNIDETNNEVLEKNKRKKDMKEVTDKKKQKRDCTEKDFEDSEKIEKKVELSENKVTNSENLDDDQAFLQSILPTFRELTTEQKFALRIEIMQTILKFKQENKT